MHCLNSERHCWIVHCLTSRRHRWIVQCLTSERRLANNFNALSHLPLPTTTSKLFPHLIYYWQSIRLSFTTTWFDYNPPVHIVSPHSAQASGGMVGETGIKLRTEFQFKCRPEPRQVLTPHKSFFHHFQGNIQFNTVNNHRTIRMYFLECTGNRDDIE